MRRLHVTIDEMGAKIEEMMKMSYELGIRQDEYEKRKKERENVQSRNAICFSKKLERLR